METNETPDDFGKNPQGLVRRWMKEIDLASKEENDWRDAGKHILDRYRGKNRKRNSFNILWSNTETLVPAIFNSPPQPNVRRRFKDADPVGKVVSQMLERCLEFQTDNDKFMTSIKYDVLDMLLPGRGISRVKYVPQFTPSTPVVGEDGETEEVPDELAWEECELEHVQWDDFRHGPGKTWEEVRWIAFRHRLTREQIEDKWPDLADKVTLDKTADEVVNKDEELKTVFGTAEVWEFWCKDYKKVMFIATSYKDAPLEIQDDPLGLIGFYPIPRPLYAITDASTLIPTPLYEQYREQAAELDRVSMRINKLIDALKFRGIYDSTVAELKELMRGDDNQLIPAQNTAQYIEKGGLEKAIWFMPIDMAAAVLKELYNQRDSTKMVIYEITGISDVMRAASDPNETLGAQKLKAKFGGQRITQMQSEVQRYVRDLIRIMSDVISAKFQPETMLKMSQMQVPTEAQVQQQMQQMQMQAQQAAQQAQSSGQPAPPPPQMPSPPVTLEQAMQVMRDDATRTFKVDVETDSMVQATMQDDMQGLAQTLSGITQFIQGVGPAVQAGAIPMDAVKEIVMTICRRSKMGSAVEDALDKMQPPQPQPDPNAGKMQIEQAKLQNTKDLETFKAQLQDQQQQRELQANSMAEQQSAQLQAQLQAHEQQVQAQQNQHQQELEAQRDQLKAHTDSVLEAQRMASEERMAAMDRQLQVLLAHINNAAKIEVAEVAASTTLQTAQISAANSAGSEE